MEHGTAADGEFDFAALIHPFSAGKFFAEHWERQPLLQRRGDENYYRRLLAIGDLEGFISRGDVRYPAIRLAKGGAFFPSEAYTQDVRYGDEVFRGLIDVEKVVTEYTSGATVTLPALHRSLPALGRLCAQMEALLDHSVHTNAYLTPPCAAGFTPHYDTHEVFVLQIAGRKHWRVYPPPLPLPHRSQPFSPQNYTLPPAALLEFQLCPGDLLYLPRGHVHTTTTAEQFSAHVTIGVTVYTGVELLSELIHAAVDEPALRASLPVGFAHPSESRALEQQLAALIGMLTGSADATALTERFVHRVRAARARSGARFQADPATIGPRSILQLAAGVDHRVLNAGGELILEIGGRRVHLQRAVEPVLEALCRGTPITPAALPAAISLDARLSLVRYLHGLGFLQLL